jgi:hypothetical protein
MLPIRALLLESSSCLQDLRKQDGNQQYDSKSGGSSIGRFFKKRLSAAKGVVVESVMDEEDVSALPTHRVEISDIHGHNFPSLSFTGKAHSYLSTSISGLDFHQTTEVEVGEEPVWKSDLAFDVVGYAHRELKFEVFYKARIFGQDKQIGFVMQSMLGLDVSRKQILVQEINLKDHPDVLKVVSKLAHDQGKQPPSIEFSVLITSIERS